MSGSINVTAGQTQRIQNSGTYSPVNIGVLGTLDVVGTDVSHIDVTFSTLTVSAGSTVNITDSDLVVNGVGNLGGLGTYVLGSGGTLDLASSISGNVITPIAFQGTAAELVVEPNISPGLLSAISGFAMTDKVDFRNISAATSAAYQNGTLSLLNGSTVVASTFVGGSLPNASYAVTSDGVSGFVATACFAAGTRILTQSGEVVVESLSEGIFVPTLQGKRLARIKWIGRRLTKCAHHPNPQDVWPIRIVPGAFGESLPIRALFLSPDHSVYVDNVLIPIRYLVNGASIAQIEVDTVSYFHLELDQHDVVMADGLPAESYLDTGNRAAFSNSDVVSFGHPDFALRVWDQQGCAPLVVAGMLLKEVRARLAERALELGYSCDLVPVLRLRCGGELIEPESVNGELHRFIVPANQTTVWLVSRSARPGQIWPDNSDFRQLGVAVAAIRLDDSVICLDGDALSIGWQPVEDGWRWTIGEAQLLLDGQRTIEIRVLPMLEYWNSPKEDAPATEDIVPASGVM